MKGFKNFSEFERLFLDELKSQYWLETHWITTQRELEQLASSEELRITLRSHNVLNMEAVLRMERVFSLLNISVISEPFRFADQMITEIKRNLGVTREDSLVRDAALIMNVQKVLHFTIASYGSLATMAQLLDEEEIHQLLTTSLEDKKVNDLELSNLAENFTNLKAALE